MPLTDRFLWWISTVLTVILIILLTGCFMCLGVIANTMLHEQTPTIMPEPQVVYIYRDEAKPTPSDMGVHVLPVEEAPQVAPSRYGFTDEEVYLLAQLLCGDGSRDGDGEYDIDYQREINHVEVNKVLSVVMNRVQDSRFPNTVREVVLAQNQFAVFPRNLYSVPSERAIQVVTDWCNAYDMYDQSTQVIAASHVYFTGNGRINITRS